MDIVVDFIRLTHERNWVGYVFLGVTLSIMVWSTLNMEYGRGSARARAIILCLVMATMVIINLVLFAGWLKFKGYIP